MKQMKEKLQQTRENDLKKFLKNYGQMTNEETDLS